jgi:hypothetical protein
MVDIATVKVEVVAQVWMHSDKGWRVVADDLDEVEFVAEQIEAAGRGLV